MHTHPYTPAVLCRMKKTLLFPPKRVKFEVTEGTVHAVGADAHIGPAGWAAFTELFGKVVAASRADVGIGPYNETGGGLRICYEGPKAACCAGGQSRPFGKMALSPLPDSLVQ